MAGAWSAEYRRAVLARVRRGRLGTVGDIAQAARFPAFKAAASVFGETINANGGTDRNRVLPGAGM